MTYIFEAKAVIHVDAEDEATARRIASGCGDEDERQRHRAMIGVHESGLTLLRVKEPSRLRYNWLGAKPPPDNIKHDTSVRVVASDRVPAGEVHAVVDGDVVAKIAGVDDKAGGQ